MLKKKAKLVTLHKMLQIVNLEAWNKTNRFGEREKDVSESNFGFASFDRSCRYLDAFASTFQFSGNNFRLVIPGELTNSATLQERFGSTDFPNMMKTYNNTLNRLVVPIGLAAYRPITGDATLSSLDLPSWSSWPVPGWLWGGLPWPGEGVMMIDD